ncbi:hypothetical protein TeGR_g2082 [Tetraparma gracilis]|uniref:Uncharacterized protein n=1 Tax=Tetraparma gracilis TaxID=2962635 RepID=A0ABQ6MHL9_9STRA|nr:hypothetical protein TeGR_g2082 [Tetraparma gracilis]
MPTEASGPETAWPPWSVHWFACMCALASLNLLLCAKLFFFSSRSVATSTLSPSFRLCIVFTLVCAFRSYFPTVYLSRACIVDTFLSNILLARLLAFVGELTWMVQVSHSLKQVNRQLENNPAVNKLANGVIFLIACAECFSTYATITKNSLFFTLEEGSWVVAGVTCISPALVLLVSAFRRRINPLQGRKYIRRYLIVMCTFMIVYDVWGVTTDVPSNFSRYMDERDTTPSPWLSFKDGLAEVTGSCTLDRSWETWSGYLLWMTSYFSLGVWSSVALALFTVPEQRGGSKAAAEPLLV